MSLGDRLKIARENTGKGQKEMASLCGASYRMWQAYESGENQPKADVIEALVKLGFNANWLLSGEGEMRRDAGPAGFKLVESPGPVYVAGEARIGQDGSSDPLDTVIMGELQRLSPDLKRIVLRLCMDLSGEQYPLVKYTSQDNRKKRLGGGDD